jgi:hypothetical protein
LPFFNFFVLIAENVPRSLQKLSVQVKKLHRFVSVNSVTPYCEMSQGNCAENAVFIECKRGTLRRLCNYSRNLSLIHAGLWIRIPMDLHSFELLGPDLY